MNPLRWLQRRLRRKRATTPQGVIDTRCPGCSGAMERIKPAVLWCKYCDRYVVYSQREGA